MQLYRIHRDRKAAEQNNGYTAFNRPWGELYIINRIKAIIKHL